MIEVINLSKSYKNNKAVNDINFDIGENEIIGLLGPNGCGKTTTIAMILGLLKPTKGKILINKKDIEYHRIELLHKMNFISPYIELPKRLSVEENLVVYGRLYGVKKLKDKIYAMIFMLIMGLSNSAYLISIMSTIQLLVPDLMRGRVMGFHGMTFSIMPLGAMYAGGLAGFFENGSVGVATTVAVGGALVSMFSIGCGLLNSNVRGIDDLIKKRQESS